MAAAPASATRCTTPTVPKIAERAGANPTSVYRRWGNRDNLLLVAAVTRLRVTSPLRGEAVPAVQDVLDHVLAPLYLRVLFRLPVEPGAGSRLVDRLLKTL
ncbi:MAG: hypothetical protein QOI78_5316 [Actinomycetota bacterium]|nr:hypothetical protein [Actinomycetota bacterium]